jgi:hypothetical protein
VCTGLTGLCVWQVLAVVALVLWQLELNGILLLGAAGPAVEFRVVDAFSGDPIERARISLRKDGAAGNDYLPSHRSECSECTLWHVCHSATTVMHNAHARAQHNVRAAYGASHGSYIAQARHATAACVGCSWRAADCAHLGG